MNRGIRFAALSGLLARAAVAHPGHGVPGWLHHGELLVVAVVVLALAVIGAARRS